MILQVSTGNSYRWDRSMQQTSTYQRKTQFRTMKTHPVQQVHQRAKIMTMERKAYSVGLPEEYTFGAKVM